MSLDWKNNVIKNFDKKSKSYDQNCIIQKKIADNLAKDLPKSGVSDILEIGCGTGNLTKHLLNRYAGKNFYITDVSPSMLDRAQEKFPDEDINWIVMDGENIETSQKYDIIVASMVFQWFEDIDETLKELVDMLKPNGNIFFTIPGPESFKEWKKSLEKLDLPAGILDFSMPKGIYIQETINHQYVNALDFLKSIKDVGAGMAKKDYAAMSPADIKKACDLLDEDYNGKVTWHILYGKISKPEEE